MNKWKKLVCVFMLFAVSAWISYSTQVDRIEVKLMNGSIALYKEEHTTYSRYHSRKIEHLIPSYCLVTLNDGSIISLKGVSADFVNNNSGNVQYECNYTYFRVGDPAVRVRRIIDSDGNSMVLE